MTTTVVSPSVPVAPTLTIPKPVAVPIIRPPKDNIPATLGERQHIRTLVERYVTEHNPTPPLPIAELRIHAQAMVKAYDLNPKHVEYLGVLINNELWKDQLATIPYERRLLLLPKCLRIEEKCPAPFDEFGLLCKQCGLCTIQDLQAEAERLGYAVLVAEGSAIVMSIVETGKIDAIVGVSCISVLERAFPYMEAAAIPGVAIPLLQDDCIDTGVDLDWVWEAIHLTSEDRTRRLDLDGLRKQVDSWFTPAAIDAMMGVPEGRTRILARDWLGKTGKRWRPFLTVAAWRACVADKDAPIPPDVHKLALAVECFHKASLIHDDIQDGDEMRYGERTMAAEVGVPMALNVGDFLLGEGYRLLAEAAPPHLVGRMVALTGHGQSRLCIGQGSELEWKTAPEDLAVLDVLNIFRGKTAPAFDVALALGAMQAGAGESEINTIVRYGDSLGIAYQINDDLDDILDIASNDLDAERPTLPMAVALERAKGPLRDEVLAWWRRDANRPKAPRMREIMTELNVETHVRTLLGSFKDRAVQSLRDLENESLKGLLRRIMGKIFAEKVGAWCKESQEAQGIVVPETTKAEAVAPAVATA